MKLYGINDIDDFLDTIDECDGEVILSSDDGDRVNLRGKLGSYLSLASLISNGYIGELEVTFSNEDDMKRLASYLVR